MPTNIEYGHPEAPHEIATTKEDAAVHKSAMVFYLQEFAPLHAAYMAAENNFMEVLCTFVAARNANFPRNSLRDLRKNVHSSKKPVLEAYKELNEKTKACVYAKAQDESGNDDMLTKFAVGIMKAIKSQAYVAARHCVMFCEIL